MSRPPAAGRPPPLPPKVPKTPTSEDPPALAGSWGIASQNPRPSPSAPAAHDYAHDYADYSHPTGGYHDYAHKVTDTAVTISDASSSHRDIHSSHSREVKKRRKVRVLSLDGGGIRGYSTLVILTELMHQLHVRLYGKPPENPSKLPKPADYFDIIGGNGTGGLIALMLGRMRMGVQECKQWYVELTRFVFITDKTVMGVPYGKTMFKKERLEQAIKECVGESTRHDNEPIQPPSLSNSPEPSHRRRISEGKQKTFGRTGSWGLSRNKSIDSGSTKRGIGIEGMGYAPRGNADAPLRDPRDGATKTFVTAVYKGSTRASPPVLLRTYPSRVESDPCPNATIWEAGRATAATLSAFKPITIEQNTFLDEGHGQYNPAATVLTEVVDNEFPSADYEVGVFVSIGTGKRPGRGIVEEERPKWWEGVVSSPFENWTEARRRLIRKLEETEKVHRRLIGEEGKSLLAEKGVLKENYYRFNVDVGVGEFAMNEWNRLPEVSTGTRRYLHEPMVHVNVVECAEKISDIEKENRNWEPAPGSLDLPPNVAELAASEETSAAQSPKTSATNIRPIPQPIPQSPKVAATKVRPVPAPPASSSQSAQTHYPGIPGQPPATYQHSKPQPQPKPQPPIPQQQPVQAPQYPIYAQPPNVESWIHEVQNPHAPPPPRPQKGPEIRKDSGNMAPPPPPPPPPPPVPPGPPQPPIIRVTSPTTVAGDDSEEEEERRGGWRRSSKRVPYSIDE